MSSKSKTKSVEIDPDLGKKLFEEGATFIFLDVPPGTEFGIDMSVFYVADKFRGVKMIPPGLHFIYYSGVSKYGQSAPRTGFFHVFSPKEVLVRKWNKFDETMSEEIVNSEETERFRSNLKDMDRFLGAYPYKMWRNWVALTSYITEPVLKSMEPESGIVCSVSQFVPETFLMSKNNPEMETDQMAASTSKTEDNLPELKLVPGTMLRFTKIPLRKHPEGASPTEITKHNMDSTYLLEQVLLMYEKPEDILAELQLSFVCFLVGHVYEAFEQWQKLIRILCNSDTALKLYGELYLSFIVVVHFQLKEIPKDFFVDIVSSSNFLTTTFQIFFSNLENSTADEALRSRGRKFKESLTKIFKWDFESEPDDCAPVIVETSQ
ncbi:protein AAR2 homolog [Centruroides sculpturatus]|uniref:protein AAR2 homolog n=1 Tax=Centruroides sculpturatus TaxID=218467 RepID=UPI000C6EC134|nr:protein AAR2 homolog [Centruroides sculpturatus]